MRVLLTVHQFMPGHNAGTEVATRDTALELKRRGHDVHVLTTEPERREKSTALTGRDYQHRGLSVHAITVPKRSSQAARLTNEYRNPAVAECVRRYLDRLDPDVVHMFHLGWLSGAVIDVFRERGAPMVFTATDFWSICFRQILAKPSGELCDGPDDISSNCLECRRAERWVPGFGVRATSAGKVTGYRRLAERALAEAPGEPRNMDMVRAVLARTQYLREQVNSVDAILAPTQLMHDRLTANGIRTDLVRVSRYGLDLTSFREARDERVEARELRLGFIGTIRQPKGVGTLIDAFKQLPPDAAVSLRIVGDLTAVPDYGREIYAEASSDSRISFTGLIPNEDVSWQLANLDVLVVPSTWYENSPITIYSAFAAGVPAIASNLGGITEIVEHETNGLLFEPGDSADLARQMRRLAEDPELLAVLRSNVREPRRVGDTVDELEALYGSLVRGELPRTTARVNGRGGRPAAEPDRRLAGNGGGGAPISHPPSRLPSRRGGAEPDATAAGKPSATRLFFIVGRAKSGTTWLTRTLNAHPDILCRGEGRFFGRDYQMGDTDITSLYGALAGSTALRRWFETSIWTRERDLEAQLDDLTGVAVRHMLERELATTGKRLVGDKTPLTGTGVVREIAAICPGARVVHVIRDGRDVAISSMHHVWNRAKQEGGVHDLSAEQLARREAYRAGPHAFIRSGESMFSDGWLAGTAREWSQLVSRARADGRDHLGDRYLEVTYEALLEAPQREARRVLEFLGAPADRATVASCLEQASFERLSRGRKRGDEDPRHFLRKGIAGEWRTVFTPDDREQFKRAAGELLIQLGYERDLDW